MSQVKSKNTSPEIFVRKLVFSMGRRYRLHRSDLPGKPDIVFPSQKKIIMVNGCFWHRHNCKKGQKLPQDNADYWKNKFDRTIARDRKNIKLLEEMGWRVLLVWECQIKDAALLKKDINEFLSL